MQIDYDIISNNNLNELIINKYPTDFSTINNYKLIDFANYKLQFLATNIRTKFKYRRVVLKFNFFSKIKYIKLLIIRIIIINDKWLISWK